MTIAIHATFINGIFISEIKIVQFLQIYGQTVLWKIYYSIILLERRSIVVILNERILCYISSYTIMIVMNSSEVFIYKVIIMLHKCFFNILIYIQIIIPLKSIIFIGINKAANINVPVLVHNCVEIMYIACDSIYHILLLYVTKGSCEYFIITEHLSYICAFGKLIAFRNGFIIIINLKAIVPH